MAGARHCRSPQGFAEASARLADATGELSPTRRPRTISIVRRKERHLATLKAELEGEFGKPVYFPFGFSDKRPMRAQQTYLMKVPAEVISVLGLNDLHEAGGLVPPVSKSPVKGRRRSEPDISPTP